MILDFLKNLFKKKEYSPTKGLGDIFGNMKQTIFPEGEEQIEKELNELASLLDIHPSKIQSIYIYACGRVFLKSCDREILITGIKRNNNTLSDEQIEILARYVFKKFVKQRISIDDEEFHKIVMRTMGFLEGGNIHTTYDEIPGGYGEFGITLTNPVPVNGIIANERYLRKLITDDGLEIRWLHTYTMGAENIDKPIDAYKISDINGGNRGFIYISSYHHTTSNKAPKGFKFR